MVLYSGSLVLLSLKIEETWQEIGGMRSTKMVINNQLIEASNIAGGNWRELLDQAGLLYVNIYGTGAFLNSKAEQFIQRLVFKSKIAEYKLVFASKDYLIGNFQVTHYERLGEVDEEECYIIALASSGRTKYHQID